jgi:hypothetical protein
MLILHALQQFLEKSLEFALLEQFDDLRDILSAIAGTDQKCIRGFHYHQIANSYRGDKFIGTPKKIPFRI